MNWIYEPWPWYISGPLITVTMFALLKAGKKFGMSSNLRTICTACGAGTKIDFFKFDWKSQVWNLIVVLGVLIGGFIASHFMTNTSSVAIHPELATGLENMGIKNTGQGYLPDLLFSIESIQSPKILTLLIIGGFLVGFGARYAGGCTSGHGIAGLSNLQLPSLIAIIGFFIGGLTMVHLIFPLIF